jgi:hypothetical protein
MEVSGYITDSTGRRLQGTAGIMSGDGKEVLAYDATAPDGSFTLYPQAGELLYFAAPGFVTKLVPAELASGAIVLNKPVHLAAFLMVAPVAYALFNQKRKKKKNKVGALDFSRDDVKTIFWIVGGVLAFDTIKKILQAIGFWKDEDERSLDMESSNVDSFWNPLYWRRSQNYSYTIDTPTAETFARRINSALGWFNDDEAAVKSVFYQLRTKANFSYLSYVYQNLFGQDLFTVLRGGLWPYDGISDAELNSINNYGKSLPNF